MDEDDLRALLDTVRSVCAKFWPAATEAPDGDLAATWQAAVQQGWTDLVGRGLVPAAVAIQQELGRVACPLPVVDVALVATIADAAGHSATVEDISTGAVRPAMGVAHSAGAGETVVRPVEAGAHLTHLLVVDEARGRFAWHAVEPAHVTARPGLAVPAWSEVTVVGEPEWSVPLDEHRDLLLLRRLGLGSRATAAVRRTHELAVEHACRREQFGQLIGAFQAVSHRLVGVETALTAARQLQAHALSLLESGDPSWRLAVEIYLEHVAGQLAQLQFDGHHTLAAVGYFDEHEAPWLFRRVHADLAVLAASTGTSVGEAIVDHGAGLPDFDLGADAERVRREVLEAFEPWRDGAPSHLGEWDDAAREVLRDRGWIGVGWPADLGGGGYDVAQLLAFSEAIAYASPPVGNIWMGIDSIVPMLTKVGPPELRDLVMEEARGGVLSVALGYSEPGSGSDLASLSTRARTRRRRVAGQRTEALGNLCPRLQVDHARRPDRPLRSASPRRHQHVPGRPRQPGHHGPGAPLAGR